MVDLSSSIGLPLVTKLPLNKHGQNTHTHTHTRFHQTRGAKNGHFVNQKQIKSQAQDATEV